ncbi:uncharacterized protein (DUF2147 family) [Spirosoma lacussanchae]|uniref:DUF2147 domain-containing protein n=1 Tax=Spirosoma lacussanchae TaxID=1884249 RepID=UPI00110938A7|nr:DUF2147 domain-containing protein [Spirosoma lacussanchae]
MKVFFFVLALLVTGGVTRHTQPPADAVTGEWLSPRKDSRITIYRQGDLYQGRILWGTGTATTDQSNPDPSLRSRNLIGLVILNGFVYDGRSTWENGTIYDPREGKTYSCKMTLTTPNSLSIRGYVGVSLFGRTEVWSRVTPGRPNP